MTKKTKIVLIISFLLIIVLIVVGIRYLSRISADKIGTVLNNEDIEYSSNELLVKFKSDHSSNINSRENISAQDTGISAIDKINKSFKAKTIEKLTNKSLKKESQIDRWYKITLDKPKELRRLENINNQTFFADPSQLQIEEIKKRYQALDEVESVSLNYVINVNAVPNDYYYSRYGTIFSDRDDMWGLKKINIGEAWDITYGNEIVVAVVDTGVDYLHPDLADNILKNGNGEIIGYNFVSDNSDPMDDHYHGTHVAGTIAAVSNNDPDHSLDTGKRVVGVGPNIKIMPLKALDSRGSGYLDDLSSAIIYAVDNGAKVINNSWGVQLDIDLFNDVIDYAYSQNVITVFAAGNSNTNVTKSSPSGYQKAITVGSTNYLDQKSCFSNWGSSVDFMAPGGDSTSCNGQSDGILSTRLVSRATTAPAYPSQYYTVLSGTSMAAPHASAAAALVSSMHSDYSVEEVRFALRNSTDILNGGWNLYTATGRINTAKALSLTSPQPVAIINLPEKSYWASEEKQIFGSTSARDGIKNWSLSYALVNNLNNWTEVSSGQSTINNDLIGTINPLANGNYVLRLSVTDQQDEVSSIYSAFIIDTELVAGWPKNLGANAYNSSAIGDINNDGVNEIILLDGNKGFLNAVNINGISLPGFPINMQINPDPFYHTHFATNPVLSDINNDGNLEIIVVNNDSNWPGHVVAPKLWVIGGQGNIIQQLDIPTLVQDDGTIGIEAAPTIIDIDKDGNKEIILKSFMGEIFIYKNDFTPLSGWPVRVTTNRAPTVMLNDGPVAVADIDNDGDYEIFAGFNPSLDATTSRGLVYGLELDGSIISGWPYELRSMEYIFSPIGLIDLDNNGEKEILFRSANSYITAYALNKNGQILWTKDSGGGGLYWPSMSYLKKINGDINIFSGRPWTFEAYNKIGNDLSGWPKLNIYAGGSIVIADILGDTDPEIIVNSSFGSVKYVNPGIEVFDLNGNIVYSKSYELGGEPPVFGDIDGDSKLEMLVSFYSAGDKNTFLWDLDKPTNQNEIIWGQFLKNEVHDAIVDLTPASEPNVTLVKTSSQTSVNIGEEIQYTLSLTNNEPLTLTNFLVRDAIPTGTSYVEGSADHGGNLIGTEIQWTIPSLTAGENISLNFRLIYNGLD